MSIILIDVIQKPVGTCTSTVNKSSIKLKYFNTFDGGVGGVGFLNLVKMIVSVLHEKQQCKVFEVSVHVCT